MSPKISVLLPCFEAAATLPEAVESILCQDFTDFEVVAVDDGSQDETLRILQSYAEQDERILIFSRSHEGLIPALNYGLEVCRAPLVARMDADDRMLPARLRLQAAYMDEHAEVGLVACLAEGFPPAAMRQGFQIYMNWQNGLLTHEQMAREIFVESPFPHPAVMYRRDIVLQAGGYQEYGWAEDYDLWLRLYLNGIKFGKVPEVLLAWRESPERLTRSDGRYSLENFIRAKAHYLLQGPLRGKEGLIIWGAGMMGRRLSKHLVRGGANLRAFVDIDPDKIGRTRRGVPVLPPEDLLSWWERFERPVLLAAVGARGARVLIRERLESFGLQEGVDWWSAA